MMDEDAERVYYSICANDPSCLTRLVKEGVDVDTVFSAMSPGGKSCWSALHLCCKKGSFDCAKVLIEAGACQDLQDMWCQTPLMYSVCAEWGDLVHLLVSSGCNINAQDKRGLTALHRSVHCSTPEMMQILIKGGANLDTKELVQCTPLWIAVSSDSHLAHAKCLIDAGCDLDYPDLRTKRTPLQAAIVHSGKDRLAYIKLLLTSGSKTGKMKRTLHSALMTLVLHHWPQGTKVSAEEKEIAELLLATPCDINAIAMGKIKIQWRGTVLKMAVQRGADVLVQMILDAGANPDLTDDTNVTPLHHAVLANRIDIVQMLLIANCEMDPVASVTVHELPQDLTPFQIALYKMYLGIAELMVNAGYDARKERYLLANQGIPESEFGNIERLFSLQERLSTAQPLLFICRGHLRKLFGCQLKKCVPELPLPPYVKGLLFLHDLC